jgi:hypothetical protein
VYRPQNKILILDSLERGMYSENGPLGLLNMENVSKIIDPANIFCFEILDFLYKTDIFI